MNINVKDSSVLKDFCSYTTVAQDMLTVTSKWLRIFLEKRYCVRFDHNSPHNDLSIHLPWNFGSILFLRNSVLCPALQGLLHLFVLLFWTQMVRLLNPFWCFHPKPCMEQIQHWSNKIRVGWASIQCLLGETNERGLLRNKCVCSVQIYHNLENIMGVRSPHVPKIYCFVEGVCWLLCAFCLQQRSAQNKTKISGKENPVFGTYPFRRWSWGSVFPVRGCAPWW